MNRGRGRGRSRGRRGAANRGMHRAIARAARFNAIRAPLRQPSVNRSFTFPLTVLVSRDFTSAGNQIFRVEDFITSIRKVVGMDTDWNTLITVSPHTCTAYGLIPTQSGQWDPSFTFWIFDPLTNNPVKAIAAIGDVDDPPRIAYNFPEEVSAHVFSWDGTTSTSANVVGFVTNDTNVNCYVYMRCTVRIAVNPTWTAVDDTDAVSTWSLTDAISQREENPPE